MDAIGRGLRTFVLALIAILLFGSLAFGQEAQVRHYQSDITMDENNILVQQHVMLGSDGRMGAVIMFGPPGTEPEVGALTGPRTFTDVDAEGVAAFCFTVDDVAGAAGPQYIGAVSCYVWLKGGDTMIETGNTPFGAATSPLMTWCGETHTAPVSGPPPPRVGI